MNEKRKKIIFECKIKIQITVYDIKVILKNFAACIKVQSCKIIVNKNIG